MLENPLNQGLTTYLKNLSDNHKPSLHEIMEANYTFNLSLAEFARICQRSLATFNREFREYYQTTPGQWLSEEDWNMPGCF
jgi:AraC-like DNA-binding protein